MEELNLELTDKQLKAAKVVYKAMREAGKLGVYFWDNYGTLQCYNAKKITLPVPDDKSEFSLRDYDPTYYEILKNYSAGNADDELFFDLK